jgi:DNA topoisomerase I
VTAVRLVIVESPKKARTIKGFLGPGFSVAASMGHVRDLPPKALGIDVQHGFQPEYVVLPRAQSALASLRKAAAGAEAVFLATDPDREGEAIAWHLTQALRLPQSRYRRIAFHEISRRAIQDALAKPRDLDTHLIDAQQARRVLDRLVGYQVSPLLWRKIQRGTSAGRVQSVAVRLIVDREREIQSFVPQEYWTIDVRLCPEPPDAGVEGARQQQHAGVRERDRDTGSSRSGSFLARLKEIDGKKAEISNGEQSQEITRQLQEAAYRVRETARKTVTRNPFPPFTTSTLQQAAGNRLRFPAKKTMSTAQSLYEAGLITYMRTDSVAVSSDAIAQARRLIAAEFGPEYVPASPRRYATKAKNAQEAHEAVRPVDLAKTPASLRGTLSAEEWRIYDLIWKRMIASQMSPARYLQDSVLIDAIAVPPHGRAPVSDDLHSTSVRRSRTKAGGRSVASEAAVVGSTEERQVRRFLLRAQASSLTFAGWLAAYGEDTGESSAAKPSSEPAEEDEAVNTHLPKLDAGQTVYPEEVLPAQHFTQPPRRYSEPSLVKALEEAGVGRPSTYATIVSTILDRGYVQLTQRHFVPTELGFAANDFLVAHFPRVVDLPFTAEMENSLDEIAAGRLQWTAMLGAFYGPFAQTVKAATTAPESPLKRRESEGPAIVPGATGTDATPRATRAAATARSGARSAWRAPATRAPRRPAAATPDPAATPVKSPSSAGTCPTCGKPLVERTSQYGPFKGCSGFPACRYIHREGQERSAAGPKRESASPRTRRASPGSTLPSPETKHVVRSRRSTAAAASTSSSGPAKTRKTRSTPQPPNMQTANVVRRARRPKP